MHRRLPLVVLVGLLAGCGGGPTAPVDRETFVGALVALRRAATDAGSTEAYEAGRAAVLAEAGVSEADLRGYVDVWGNDPVHMAAVWAEVRDRLQGNVDPEGLVEEEGGPLGEDGMPLEEAPLEAPAQAPPSAPGAARVPTGEERLRARRLPALSDVPPDTSAAAYSHSMVAGGFELTS